MTDPQQAEAVEVKREDIAIADEATEIWARAMGGPSAAAIAAALARRAAEAQIVAWQPIETAPRDGTRFLAYGHRGPCIDIIEWGNGRYLGRTRGYEQRWISQPGYGVNPTHWTPLPAPPADRRPKETAHD